MGLFSRGEDREAKAQARVQALSDKARAKAAQSGLDVADAVAVAHQIEGSANIFLIVYPDRVELANTGKIGSLLRKGAGTDTIPTSRISSVECHNKGIWSYVEVHTSGNTIKFQTDLASGPYLRQTIIGQISGAATSPAPPEAGTSPDVLQQLQQLADLHKAGVLTDEEFADKKQQLLGRL